MISELIGECKNKDFLLSGKASAKHINPDGSIKNFPNISHVPLKEHFVTKYRMRELEAEGLADFLSKCFAWEPKDRWSASKLLDHWWLKMIPNYNTHMEPGEAREYKRIYGLKCSPSPDNSDEEF